MRSRRDNLLFCGTDWHSCEEAQKRALESEIDAIDGDRLLNTSVEDLCAFCEEKFSVEVPTLHEDRIVVDGQEVQIDVSQDGMRDIRDRTRPFHIPGTLVEVTVPFSGDAQAFQIQPTAVTTSRPEARVASNALIIEVQGAALETEATRTEINRRLGGIKQYLESLGENARGFNERLGQLARQRIEQRREKLLADRNLVANLGFPLKERLDASPTFAAPEVRRRLTPKRPLASTAPYEPEPALASDDYEHILSVINSMAVVMERSPRAFAAMDEEALRSHFLVQLNGHYEGHATGETFNYEGKTDILIRVAGRNIFIAECKYWDGPTKFSNTIDQLLRYVSWRDTKTAIIVFNRNKTFTRVVEAIPDAAKAHPNFKRQLKDDKEGEFRYVFSHRDDQNREMLLAVLAFDVPSGG